MGREGGMGGEREEGTKEGGGRRGESISNTHYDTHYCYGYDVGTQVLVTHLHSHQYTNLDGDTKTLHPFRLYHPDICEKKADIRFQQTVHRTYN